jgi:hypothetical protein
VRTARRLFCVLVRYLKTLLATELAGHNDDMLGETLVGRDACIIESSMNVYCWTVLNVRYCNIILVGKKKLCFTMVSF